MSNIFVYHAQDHVGRALAAFIRLCDDNQQFQYLPIERIQGHVPTAHAAASITSIRRMRTFLVQQGLRPENVPLPFVVVVRDAGRSVLHGDALERWFGGLFDALTESAPERIESLWANVLSPHLTETVLRLVTLASPNIVPAKPPPPPAYIEEFDEDDVPPPPPPTKMTPTDAAGPRNKPTTPIAAHSTATPISTTALLWDASTPSPTITPAPASKADRAVSMAIDEEFEGYHTSIATVPDRGMRPRRNASFDRQAVMSEGNQRDHALSRRCTVPRRGCEDMVKGNRRINGKEKDV